MKNDAICVRAMANTLRRVAESRKCIGNAITVMALVDYAAAGDELADMIDADDERAKNEFAAEAPTAPAALITTPGVGAHDPSR